MQQPLKNILVPTDFSAAGNSALLIAIELCKQHNAVLHLLHVVEKRYIITSPAADMALPTIAQEIDTASRTKLYHVYESILREHTISIQIHMPTGIPFDEICHAADEMPIDLIVMGTHGASGIRDFFMGTTAYAVIKNTTRPVLTIPAGFDQYPFAHILFPLRAVPGVKEKFDYLRYLLGEANNATVYVAALCKEGNEAHLLANEDTLDEIVFYLEQHHLQHEKGVYTCCNLATKVLELATVHTADLIVINATLDYKWAQFFMGPFTQQVINHAKVPVLSFRQAIDVPTTIKKATEAAFVKKVASL